MSTELRNIEGQLIGNDESFQQHQLSELEQKIVSNLVQLRKSKKISQEQLATKLNTKQSVISRIENGASVPSLGFIGRVAKALDTEVEITFKERSAQGASSPGRLANAGVEYICVDCLYQWQSQIERSVMQCPQCHKRQGVMLSEYLKALRAFQDMKLQVKKSPPFKKLPPVRSIRNDSSKMLKLILETAGDTFPSPRLPISLLFRIIEQSKQERITQKSATLMGVSGAVQSQSGGEE
jgi:transcriptional regulator with XRE-family HTH domain